MFPNTQDGNQSAAAAVKNKKKYSRNQKISERAVLQQTERYPNIISPRVDDKRQPSEQGGDAVEDQQCDYNRSGMFHGCPNIGINIMGYHIQMDDGICCEIFFLWFSPHSLSAYITGVNVSA